MAQAARSRRGHASFRGLMINPDPPSGILAIVCLNFCVKPFLLAALRVVAAEPLEPPHASAQPQQLRIAAAQRHDI